MLKFSRGVYAERSVVLEMTGQRDFLRDHQILSIKLRQWQLPEIFRVMVLINKAVCNLGFENFDHDMI